MVESVADRLLDAINKHDIDALEACFAPMFECDWPAHPARSFTGSKQVRRNWEAIFASHPTVQARIFGRARTHDDLWAEWEFMSDVDNGVKFWQRGVIIVKVEGDRIAQARFYMEPVEWPREADGVGGPSDPPR
ncbi:nuclear transport factor 2 family protein [Spirillospora sp. NPDC052269]